MPLLTELMGKLPKIVTEALPEAKEPLRKMLNVLAGPTAKESITAVENATRRAGVVMDSPQWGLWRQLSLPIAQAARTKRLGKDSSQEVLLEYLQDSSQIAVRGRAAFNLGREAKLPEIPENILPADTKALELEGTMRRLTTELHKAKARKETKRVAELTDEIKSLTPLAERARGEGAKDIPWWSYWGPWSPKIKFETALGEQNLAVDKAHSDHFQANVYKSLISWWHGVTGKGGPGQGFKDLSNNRQFVKDFDKLYHDVDPWLERYYANMAKIGKMRPKADEIRKANPGKTDAELTQISSEFRKLQREVDKLKPNLIADKTEINKRFYPVARKWFTRPGDKGADIRIALYRDPAYRHWVEPLMNENEKAVAEAHQRLMPAIAEKLEQRGIPTLKTAEEYVHHSLRHIRGGHWRTLSAREAEKVDHLASRISPFVHRNYGSLPLFPSIHGSTKGYLGTVARKMALTDLKRKWYPLMQGAEAPMKEFPNLLKLSDKYLGQFEKNLFNDQWWEKMFHYGTMSLYATKVWGAPSVMFKHGLKMVRLFSTNPYDAIKTLPKTVKGGLQIALQKFDVKPGKEAILMRNFTASRSFFEAMSGIRPDQTLMDGVNTVFNAGVGGMEMFERGWAVMIALSKAQRKGLSMEKTMQGLWNTILTNNFLGGADRPLWMMKSWQQFAAPFFYTPLRITEETIGMVLRSLPKKVIKGMGEEALQYSWNYLPRDVFGTPYIKHMLYFGGATALLEAYARKHDLSLWQTVAAHIPGIRPTATGYDIGIPPAQIYRDFTARGGDVEALTSALFDFFTATPALDKLIQLRDQEASKIYGDDWRRVIFSLPSQKAIKEMKEKAARAQFSPSGHLQKYLDAQRRLKKTALGRLYPVKHFKTKAKPWELQILPKAD